MNKEMARRLASDIRARRTGLANEEALIGQPLASYVRSKKLRDQERELIRGMVIGLTYVLGDPLNMAAAEALIESVRN